MNTLFVPAEHFETSIENQSTDDRSMDVQKIQNENVSYEYKGYQVRVHFNGRKTLMQCIKNLMERRIGC